MLTLQLGANIGLALQNNYAALLVLRCLQSTGSSGTVALGNGVVGDIASSGERGKFMGTVFQCSAQPVTDLSQVSLNSVLWRRQLWAQSLAGSWLDS